MFNTYSQESCQFECRLRYAGEKAGCIPWDYPHPDNLSNGTGLPFCLSNENATLNTLAAFEAAMNSNTALKGCSCSPNCQEIKYKTQVRRIVVIAAIFPLVWIAQFDQVSFTELDTLQLCNEYDWRHLGAVMSDWQATNSPLAYWINELRSDNHRKVADTMIIDTKLLGTRSNISFGLPTEEAINVCRCDRKTLLAAIKYFNYSSFRRRFKEDFALLRVQIAEPTAMQIKRDIKLDFSGRLGVVGMSFSCLF